MDRKAKTPQNIDWQLFENEPLILQVTYPAVDHHGSFTEPIKAKWGMKTCEIRLKILQNWTPADRHEEKIEDYEGVEIHLNDKNLKELQDKYEYFGDLVLDIIQDIIGHDPKTSISEVALREYTIIIGNLEFLSVSINNHMVLKIVEYLDKKSVSVGYAVRFDKPFSISTIVGIYYQKYIGQYISGKYMLAPPLAKEISCLYCIMKYKVKKISELTETFFSFDKSAWNHFCEYYAHPEIEQKEFRSEFLRTLFDTCLFQLGRPGDFSNVITRQYFSILDKVLRKTQNLPLRLCDMSFHYN